MTAGLLDHLWQSSLFAMACAALTLAFRANGAAVRFWLWFAASVKFLLPFAALAALGEYLSGLFPHIAPPVPLLAIQPVAARMAEPVRLLAPAQGMSWAPWLAGLWLVGASVVLLSRAVRGLRLKAALTGTRDLALPAPVPVKASASLLEPGLVGIFRPVILFPAGLLDRLSRAEVEAILAHESAHLARRDNVTAAVHMLVEGLFWFHPLVWLIGARLIAERERACDETVLARGHDAQVYAGGILGVCKFCIASPLACAPGASGADLSARVTHIMMGAPGRDVGGGKQLLLAGSLLASLSLPVMVGFVAAPLVVAVKSQVAAAQVRAVQAISDGMAAVAGQIAAPEPHVVAHRLRLRVAVMRVTAPALAAPEAPQPMPVVVAPTQAVPVPAPVVVAPAPADPMQQAVVALDPRGEGDPEAVTCRVPQALPGTHLPGPKVCKVNRLWAELRINHAVISPDGREVDLPGNSDRAHDLKAQYCDYKRVMGGAGNSATGMPLTSCY